MYGIDPPFFEEADFEKKSWFDSVYQYVISRTQTITVTAAYTVDANVFWVRADATAGAFTVTLPDAELWWGRQIGVKKIDAVANTVTVSTADGATTALAARYDRVLVISNGTTWDVVSPGGGTAANSLQLLGGTWAVPGTIGSTTPNTGAFTTLSATSLNVAGVIECDNTVAAASGIASTHKVTMVINGTTYFLLASNV